MKYLSKQKIVEINKKTVSAHGGNFVPPQNILKGDNLDYLVEAVEGEMFGAPIYPEIHQKAAVYFYNIINGHIFTDGNKRTALVAAIYFLNWNGYKIKVNIDNTDIQIVEPLTFDKEKNTKLFQMATFFAAGLGDLELCTVWFKNNIEAQ